MYYDANNLEIVWTIIHDAAILIMNQPLLYFGFKWLTKNDQQNGKFNRETGKCWMLEVDLEYPKELHQLHNDYQLAPEKLATKKKIAFRIPN